MRNWILYRIFVWVVGKMGYSMCLWVPPGADDVKVLHLYDHEYNLVKSMRDYLDD